MNLLKDPKTNWKYILIVIILAILVGGGILFWEYWWAPPRFDISTSKYMCRDGNPALAERLDEFREIRCLDCVTKTAYICGNKFWIHEYGGSLGNIVDKWSGPYEIKRLDEFKEAPILPETKDETVNWKTYRNEGYGLEFQYPKEWEALTLESQKTKEVYRFNSQNEKVKVIWYHKPSGIIAFIVKGKKYGLVYGGDGYQDILKIIYPNKEIKTIYVVSPEKVSWYGRIIKEIIHFSPNGEYICFIEKGYEWSRPYLLNINTGLNLLKDYNIWFSDPYENVYWSQNNKVLAIESNHEEFGGEGIDGIFVSNYGEPEKLNEVFSLSMQEHFAGVHISDLHLLNDTKLFFSVFDSEEKKISNYNYVVKTKELKEIKE